MTIENVKYVVDSGFVKQKMFDPKSGMDTLVVVPVSQSAATQRSGRSGRTGPGKSFRLYSRAIFENDLDEDAVPEIQRTSLTGSVLQLLKIGVRDILSFDFMDRPDENCLRSSLQQLFLLDAITEYAELTQIGEWMSRFPISPFLARALIASASEFNCLEEVATIVSMLSSEDIWLRARSKKEEERLSKSQSRFFNHLGDHLSLLSIFQDWKREGKFSFDWAKDNSINYRSLISSKSIREQIMDVAKSLLHQRHPLGKTTSEDSIISDRVLMSFCSGFYMNCARKNPSSSVFYHVASNLDSSTLTIAIDEDSAFSKSHTFKFLPRQHSNSLLALYLHPTSCLLELVQRMGNSSLIDCVIYNEVICTQRSFMRAVSIIKYEWVQPLMEKLKVVGTLPCLKLESMPSPPVKDSSSVNEDQISCDPVIPDSQSKAEEARERYLKRR